MNGALERRASRFIDPARDRVQVDGRRVGDDTPRVVIALHKPRGLVTTRSDPGGRPTVYDALGDVGRWVFPVGRLDRDTSGLLVLTNDHRLGERLTSPDAPRPEDLPRARRGRARRRDAPRPARGPAARRRHPDSAGQGEGPRDRARKQGTLVACAEPGLDLAGDRPHRGPEPTGAAGWARPSGTTSSSSCGCASAASTSASSRRASGGSSGPQDVDRLVRVS